MSIRTVASKRSINQVLQSKNTLAQFAQPVYYNGNLSVHQDLWVGGNEQLNGNLSIGGNLTVGYLTVRNNEQVNGNVTVNGNEQIGGNLTVTGNVATTGTILARTFLPGQVINVSMLSYTDLGQSTKTITSGQTNGVFSIPFTPKYSNSYLIVEYQTDYSVNGGGTEVAFAYLYVNDGTDYKIGQTYQNWINTSGGGTRSGVLFPIVGRYTNTNTSAKTIRVDFYNGTDDTFTVESDISTWLKITEIAR